jgi:hypothetical protein
MPRIDDPYHFLDLSLSYYLTGRFAALNHLEMAPNLMHHAIELLIKFGLLKDVPEQQRSDATAELGKKYDHRLNALWAQFKQQVASADLSRFDLVVFNLHRWEKLRYGGFPEGAQIIRGIGLERGYLSASSVTKANTYDFGLREVDELYATLIEASNLNPAFLGSSHRHDPPLREWYERENRHVMPDLFGS